MGCSFHRSPASCASLTCCLPLCCRYQVQKENVYDAFYRLSDSKQQISSYIFDTVRWGHADVPVMMLHQGCLQESRVLTTTPHRC
jgi:hypothetical protein